ncbi:RloB domain-containing protein [Listeria marthii]|uniref:RloB family protein n=1 Tax=Listeria marthii TaxID=529731 RepID=UPI0016270888|nr:RloB family protein [Listeria marthii]MBC2101966.1 RloB domain-containing protein [Listeria marthii]
MGRKSQNKSLKKEIKIYCEGKTEKIYFDLLKQKYRLPHVNVRIKGEKGQSFALVKYVLRSLDKMSLTERNKIDKILVVFDKDDDSWEAIENAFKLAKANNIGVCFSNECFELWLLGHFEKIHNKKKWSRKLLYTKLTQILKVKSYEDEKANKTIIQRIFTKIDATESNCDNFSDDFKKMNYCDMKNTIKEIFESNVK